MDVYEGLFLLHAIVQLLYLLPENDQQIFLVVLQEAQKIAARYTKGCIAHYSSHKPSLESCGFFHP
jgi:hypothetical protein